MEKISGGKEKNKVVNELLKDNPHMSKKRVRETEKKERKEKEILWTGDESLGRGQKAYPPSHLEKGSLGGGGGGVHPLESS